MMVVDAVRLLLFPAMMAYAASSDLMTMTISNRISLILIGGFAALAPIAGMGLADITSHVTAAAMMLALGLVCFARGWIGGGDAKLAAATTLWLGFEHLVPYLIYASLIGGVLTLLLLRLRITPLPAVLAGQDWIRRLHRKDAGIPYGIALATAALVIYPETPWMTPAV
jgi:prepilin peptidase CpaA